ncbi:MAG: SsrA-binding protein SmpB [Sandaracinaceae bacterium]|nr:SsrA-binding protein SmpB [Sandaracinaceae bacterium]
MSKKSKKQTPGELLVCRNPKATKTYDIEERIEAGIVLTGSEVKSLRLRRADLEGAYATIERGEMVLHKMHIAPYEFAGAFGHEPKRSRKLLVNRREIERWEGRLTTKGYTIVPLAVYFKGGWAKVELGLGKGRKVTDKREDLKREVDLREARSAMGKGR